MGGRRVSRTRVVLVVIILGAIEGLFRLFFYYEAVFAGVPLLQPMPPVALMNIVNGINLVLGLAGLATIIGLLLTTRWGYWGTIAVSIATVIFDGVSGVAVSFTAFAGLVLPAFFIVILLAKRQEYFGTQGRTALASDVRRGGR